jgi:hypothetical protein
MKRGRKFIIWGSVAGAIVGAVMFWILSGDASLITAGLIVGLISGCASSIWAWSTWPDEEGDEEG